MDEEGKDAISESFVTNQSEKNINTTTNNTLTRAQTTWAQEPIVDRGYSWVVIIGVFCTVMFNASLSSINTILFQVYTIRYQLNATSAGWIVSLPGSLRFLSSPLVGLLFHKFSVRTVAMAGAVMQCFGLLIVAFAKEVWVLYLTSILIGVGSNMFVVACFVIIPQYFVKKRGVALGFALCGYGVGSTIAAPVVTWSFEVFGVTQTLIFLSCSIAHIVVTTALFRPQLQPKDTGTNDAETKTRSRWQVIKDKYGLGLITKPVLMCLIITVASLHCMMIGCAVFISGLAKERANITPQDLATMISISGFVGFARLPTGFVFDFPKLLPYRMYLFCVLNLLAAVLLFVTSFTTGPIAMITWFEIYCLVMSSVHSQYSNMLTDLVRAQDFPSVIALNRTVIGISLLITPVFVGRIKDLLGSFQLGFIIITINHVVIVIAYMIVYTCWRRREVATSKTDDIEL